MKLIPSLIVLLGVISFDIIRSQDAQVSEEVQQFVPHLSGGFVNELADRAGERLIERLEDEVALQRANVERIRAGCFRPGPDIIIPGTGGDGTGDPELCRYCFEKKTRYHITRCALAVDWGIPNCVRLREAMSADTAAGRTTAVTELLRWFRCLCDPTGHAANAFTESCSNGVALNYGRNALTHCGLDEGRLQGLAQSMVDDGESWFDVLTQVQRNCGIVLQEGGTVLGPKPTCMPEMTGYTASRSSIPDRCRYFYHHKDCRDACKGAGSPPIIIPGEPIFDPNCPGLAEAECALEKAQDLLREAEDFNLPLAITRVDLVVPAPDRITVAFTVLGFDGTANYNFNMDLGLTLNDYIDAIPTIIDNMIDTQSIRIDPATCLLPPPPEPIVVVQIDDEDTEVALNIQTNFIIEVNNPMPELTQFIESGLIDITLGVPVDLILVIDSSGSIGVENYAIAINFLNDLLEFLDVDNPFGVYGSRLGVVTFSTRSKTGIEFNYLPENQADKNELSALKTDMVNIDYKKGSTSTHTGLQFALDMFQDTRPYAKKIIAVVTDGFSDNGGRTCEKAAELKGLGHEIFVFGITPNVRKEELECMASIPENIFEIKSFESAAKITTYLREVIKKQ